MDHPPSELLPREGEVLDVGGAGFARRTAVVCESLLTLIKTGGNILRSETERDMFVRLIVSQFI
jgi:hypothetical protein